MVQTLKVDNFNGVMTIYQDGDINSGRSYVQNVAGWDPFVKPGNLTWSQAPSQIDSGGSVITDLILAGKERVESGILYVYAIGHTGRLYKIQVNDPNTFNPDYDNPVLLATLTSGSPTFTRGGFMDFFGDTERIYIGHDKGVTRINFDGTSETAISGTWAQTVPRPLKQFIGKLYIGNGSNIAEIDSTATVTSSTKLSPGFPTNTQVRDMDVTPDGTYLQTVVTRLALGNITSTTTDTSITANSESYIFKWNGTDTGYTSFVTFPSFSLTANTMFQNYQYTFGFDQYGMAVFNPNEKIIQWAEAGLPLPNSIVSTGNLLQFLGPVFYNGVQEIDFWTWGSLDWEVGPGFWNLFFMNATSPETDIIQSPCVILVSNIGIGSSSNGYTDSVFGKSKIYFSTLETSNTPSTAYRFYKWSPAVSANVASADIIVGAVYQTQSQLFSKKVSVKEVRVYGEPWQTGVSFTVHLVGSGGYSFGGGGMTGGNKTFTAGSNLTVGDDFAWYTPDCAPTYAIGVVVETVGVKNFVINKIEIDYAVGGK